VLAYLDSVRTMLEPVAIGMFAGKLDYSKLSFLDRIIAKKVMPEGDWRNWETIRDWASELQPTIVTDLILIPNDEEGARQVKNIQL
jgi:menaquinone-dependent protoporphyrinogen IX oxidase